MVVPYGDPGALHGWKNAFDAGEWGLGRMTQPLTLGCDCLGEIHYFDATLANEQGEPWVDRERDLHARGGLRDPLEARRPVGRPSEVRRSRRLVVSFIATVGNYEYGFFWYFYLDGNIQLEVKLTGIVSPMAIEPGTQPEFANVIARRRRRAAPPAPVQRPARLRRRRRRQRGLRGRRRAHAARARQPVGERVPARSRRGSRPSRDAQRDTDAARVAHVADRRTRTRATASGSRSAYKLVPTMSTPTLLAHPDSPVGKRAGFAQHNLWVTPYAPDERRAAGEYPNQHAGGDGLPRWTGARPLDRRAPTSSSGTRSASRTSCGPRTGRSCRSSTPASC